MQCARGADLPRGQLLALLGPSGCGKTTTLRLIAGFEALDGGLIEIGGQRVAGPGCTCRRNAAASAWSFRRYALFPHLTVAQNVVSACTAIRAMQRNAWPR